MKKRICSFVLFVLILFILSTVPFPAAAASDIPASLDPTDDCGFDPEISAEEEAELTQKIHEVINSFGFTQSTSDYEKICTIYEYIFTHVSYDYSASINVYDFYPYTAYKAMIEGKAVCEGQSRLLSRMCYEVGIHCPNLGNSYINHAWNIVELEGKYYLLDITWEDSNGTYFLRGLKYFPKHMISIFAEDYPFSDEDYLPRYNNCAHASRITSKGVDVTCTGDGHTEEIYCKRCHYVFQDSVFLNRLGHDWETTVVAEPTCTEEGQASLVCRRDSTHTETQSIPELGHDPEVTKGLRPTCTEEGYSDSILCRTCGETLVMRMELAPLGHNYLIIYRKFGCTSEGINTYVCTRDESHTYSEIIPPLGHDYEDGKCTLCGKKESIPPVPTPTPAPTPTPTPTVKPNDFENPFTDVVNSDWFYAPVMWAVQNNVTGGTSATTFSPNNPCTRAAVVTFLWAANGKPEPAATDNPFTDVSEADWYYKAVMWAVENSVTGGTSATTFSPNNPCTRAQVVTFLYAAQGKPPVQTTINEFSDIPDNAWYLMPVLWAKQHEVTGGVALGMFGPDQTCTRAQIATFLYKAIG